MNLLAMQCHNLKNIFLTDPEDRTDQEVADVVSVLSKINFFKERKISEEDLMDIINYFMIEEGKRGDEVITYGTKGQKFYLIL